MEILLQWEYVRIYNNDDFRCLAWMNTKSHNYVMGASTVTRATLDWVLKKLDEEKL